MAVVPSGSFTVDSSSAARSSVTRSHTVPAGSDRYLVVAMAGLNTEWGKTCTYAGTPMHHLHSQYGAVYGTTTIEIWGLENPKTGANDIVFTANSSMSASCLMAQGYVGADPDASIGGAARATQAAGTTISTAFNTLFDDEMMVCFGSTWGGDTDPLTQGAGWSLLGQGATGASTSADIGYIGQNKAAGSAGSHTADYSYSASDDAALAVVGLRPATADAGVLEASSVDAFHGVALTTVSSNITVNVGDDLLLAFVVCDGDCDTISCYWDGGSQAMAHLAGGDWTEGGLSGLHAEVWYLFAPGAATGTVTATHDANSTSRLISLQVWSDVQGVLGGAAVDSAAAAGAVNAVVTPSYSPSIIAVNFAADTDTNPASADPVREQYGWLYTAEDDSGGGSGEASARTGYKRASLYLGRNVGTICDIGSVENGIQAVIVVPTGAVVKSGALFLPVIAFGANF